MPSIPTNVKKEVEKRAQGYCEYCKSQSAFSPDSFSIEHIIPRSKGGNTELDNLALACQGCNNAKYNHIEGLDPIALTLKDAAYIEAFFAQDQKDRPWVYSAA